MLKMCIRRLAAAVTKSIAGGSSWQQEEGTKLTRAIKNTLHIICVSPTFHYGCLFSTNKLEMTNKLRASFLLNSWAFTIKDKYLFSRGTDYSSIDVHFIFSFRFLRQMCNPSLHQFLCYLVPHQLGSFSLLLQLWAESFHAVLEQLTLTPNTQNLLVLQTWTWNILLRMCWGHTNNIKTNK